MLTKKKFYILSFTWGILMTLIGFIVAAIFLLTKHKAHKNVYGWYFVTGKGWGGVDLGMISIVNENPSRDLLNHEFGHAVQNCYWGILFIPIIAIPSAVRYWYREYLVRFRNKNYWDLPDYDSIWFEGQATNIGNEYYKNLKLN